MFLISSDSGAFGIVLLGVVMIACILIFGLIIPAKKRARFNDVRDNLKVGMSEDEMIGNFGQPAKSVVIADGTKVVLYLHGRERHVRGNIEVDSIIIVIVDGIIASVSI